MAFHIAVFGLHLVQEGSRNFRYDGYFDQVTGVNSIFTFKTSLRTSQFRHRSSCLLGDEVSALTNLSKNDVITSSLWRQEIFCMLIKIDSTSH